MAEDVGAVKTSLPPPPDSLPARPPPAAEPESTEVVPLTAPDAAETSDDVPDSKAKSNGEGHSGVDSHAGNPQDDITEEPVPEVAKSDEGEVAAAGNGGELGAESSATPSSSKKSSKRKSSGIPEHKAKRPLNKKKSTVDLSLANLQAGDYVFALMKGYAPWPSIVCSEDMLPLPILNSRPVSAMRLDGSYREDYQPGGKNYHDRKFPVMYLRTNEFSWTEIKDLRKLDPDNLPAPPNKCKQKKELDEAYVLAAEKHDLDYYKTVLLEHEQAAVEEAERTAAAKTSKKSKRKSKDLVPEEVDAPEDEDVEMADAPEADEMEIEAEEEEAKPKNKSKKRKKNVDSDDEETKPAKTPKQSESAKKAPSKLKLTTPKTPNGVPSAKKPKATPVTLAKSSKSKASAKKKTAKESDEENPPTSAKADEKPLTIEEARQKKEQNVLYLRHRLQRGFLARDAMPKEEEMESMNEFMDKLQGYADLEVSIIRATKINKVLKAILKLPSIPRDDDFNFKTRALELLGGWNKILASEPEISTPTTAQAGHSANGIKKSEPKDDSAEEKEQDAAPPSPSAPETTISKEIKGSEGKDQPMADAQTEPTVPEKTDKPEVEETAVDRAQLPETGKETESGEAVEAAA